MKNLEIEISKLSGAHKCLFNATLKFYMDLGDSKEDAEKLAFDKVERSKKLASRTIRR